MSDQPFLLQTKMMAARRWAHIITLHKSPSLSFIFCLHLEIGKLRELLHFKEEQKAYETGSRPRFVRPSLRLREVRDIQEDMRAPLDYRHVPHSDVLVTDGPHM